MFYDNCADLFVLIIRFKYYLFLFDDRYSEEWSLRITVFYDKVNIIDYAVD